ncbi:MAG: NusG domain II-containing protein, partial [Oscillospiraceae bacterium]
MNKKISIALVILFLLCICVIFFRPKGLTAIVTENGKETLRISLNHKDEIIKYNDNVSFEIKENKIRFIDVNCPDKICENTGFLYKEG